MIRQTFRIGEVHAVLNHPAILPGISADGAPLDVTELLLSGTARACLAVDEDEIFHDGGKVVGCYLFVQTAQRAWEIHSNLLPEARGSAGVVHTQDAIEWAFANLDAEVLYTQSGSEEVTRYAELHGFTNLGSAKHREFPRPCTLLRLTIHEWIFSGLAGERFIQAGRQFHQVADQLRREAEQESHGEDEMHDRLAGFVVRMLRHCQLEGAFKAERLYNEWAVQANYHPIKLVTAAREEMVVDIGDMILAMGAAGDFWRLQ